MSSENRIRLLIDQKVRVRDGVRLSVDVFLPPGAGPFPAILTRNPYESNSPDNLERGAWWADRGYVFVSADCRGRYESEGTFYPHHPDGKDGFDTLEWVAGQPWCNGAVGTTGMSYGGAVQWELAALGSPHLKAMAAHVYGENRFRDLHYIGGAFQLTLSLLAAITFSTNLSTTSCARVFDNGRTLRELPLIDLDVVTIGKQIPWYRDWLTHHTYDEYWNEIDTADKYDRIDAPVFMRGGWFDAFSPGMFRLWQGMTRRGKTERARRNQKLLVGPWAHVEPDGTRLGDLDFGPSAYIESVAEEKRWFDHWLRGIDNGVADEPPIKIFVMGENVWRYENEWPLERARLAPYYLHSGGSANSAAGDGVLSPEKPGEEPPDRFDYDPDRPVPSIGGNLSTGAWVWTTTAADPIIPGPIDQRIIERRDDVLVYTTETLLEDLEVTGLLEVILYAASSAPDTDFTARLVDVYPTGEAIVMAEGIIRARYRNGVEETQLLVPGEVERFRIELYPTSNVFRRGHRIRLDVSSSSFPRFSRNLNTDEDIATGTRIEVAHQTIEHSTAHPSHVLLPIIPR